MANELKQAILADHGQPQITHRGEILPLADYSDGSWGWAAPQMAVDAWDGIKTVHDAYTGELQVPQSYQDASPEFMRRGLEAASLIAPAATHMPMSLSSAAMDAPAFVPTLRGGSITAYHGSPYDFDQFDLANFGRGEKLAVGMADNPNAKAYAGRGFYFADHPKVAEDYRDFLSSAIGAPKGKVYQVKIPQDGLIDFNKTIGEMPDDLRQLANSKGFKNSAQFTKFWRKYEGEIGDKAAAETLSGMGVKGIVHDDPLRPNKKYGRNYSVFDPADIEILKKYGLVGATGATSYAADRSDDGR